MDEQGALKKVLYAGMLALALAISLFCINSSTSIMMVLLYALLTAPLAAFSVLFFYKVRDMYLKRKLEEELIEGMYSIIYYKTRDLPFQEALSKAAESSGSNEVRIIFHTLVHRMRLGETFNEAVRSLYRLKGTEILNEASVSKGDAGISSIRKVIDAYEYSLEEKRARVDESMQKHATINMFLSTVLPSFVIFSFMGGIILTQKNTGSLLFSVVMLVMLPFMYMLGTVFLNRGLIG